MRVCGKEFDSDVIGKIRAAMEQDSSLSRCRLSRQVCEWMGWRAPNGKLQEMSCRKALLELERRGLVELPRTTEEYAFQRETLKARREIPELSEVRCSLGELGDVEIEPVGSRYSKASEIWNGLMERYHYLGGGPLCGNQIRYLIRSSEYGWLGGLSFSSAVWHMKDRDKRIGWSERARIANLRKVVSNSRFLIVPGVEVPNLGSYVLSRSTKRLCGDWEERYGYRPLLLETFVDPKRYRGTSYRAANWEHIGRSSGRRGGEGEEEGGGSKKDIYLYPLAKHWQAELCREPELRLGEKPRPIGASDWAEEEFGRVDIYDNRLRRRLFTLARDFHAQSGELVPQACNGSEAKTKAAYRFFCNKQVDMQTLLKPHVESTTDRINEHELVLAVQDSSTLDYTAHPGTKNLGPINTKRSTKTGLILHDTMAFTPEGTPLGLLDVQCWARDPNDRGKKERRSKLPIEEKESMKWLNSHRAVREIQRLCPRTKLVSVGDREADIYELFHERVDDPTSPELLVRAERTRNRKVGEEKLWEKMEKEDVRGHRILHIPRKGRRPARDAKLEVRFAGVTLKPPQGKDLSPIGVWAVYAREVDCPSDVKNSVEWMLLTTIEVSCFAEAIERLDWYSTRWGIEDYHRTLKSGCRIQDRRLNDADRLKACLAIDMVIAWRVLYLTKLSRETPDVPCTKVFEEEEWKALHVFKREAIPAEPPELRTVTRMVASLGGFLGRKSDGEPGPTRLWRGLQRLGDMKAMYILLTSRMPAGP